MQSKERSAAQGRLLCVGDTNQVIPKLCLKALRSWHQHRQSFRRSFRPVHHRSRFKLEAPHLLQGPATASLRVDAALQTSRELVTRRAVDSAILLQGRQSQTLSLRFVAGTRCKCCSGITAGFGWTSCDQISWYNQIREKVDSIKV